MQIVFSTEAAQKVYASTDSVFSALQDVFAPKAGDTVTATVIFASAPSVNIKLQNGAVIRATIEGSAELTEGDVVRFLVGESSRQRISLIPVEVTKPGSLPTPWPLPPETATAQSGGKQAVFNAIYRNGYPYSPELAEKSAKILSAFPGIEAETAVFIAANDIPVTQANIDSARALQNPDLKAGSLIGQLLDLLSNALSQNGSKKGSASALVEAGVMDESFIIGNLPGRDTAAAQSGASSVASTVVLADVNESAAPGVFISQSIAAERVPAETADISAGGNSSNGGVPLQADVKAAITEALLKADGTSSPSLNSFAQILRSLSPSAASPEKPGPGGGMPFDATAIQSLEDSLFVSAQTATGAKLQDAAAFLPQKLSLLAAFAMAAGADREKITTGTGRQTHLSELLEKVMLVACFQIPLRLGTQRSTAEMYVLRRKKKSSGSVPGEISALITLDTRNMGHIEALLRIRERGVSAEVTAENEQIAEHIRERSCELYALLSSAGYRLTHIRVTAASSRTTPVNAPAVFLDDENTRNQKINIRI